MRNMDTQNLSAIGLVRVLTGYITAQHLLTIGDDPVRHGTSNLESKRPRYHPVIAWENNNLTNDFVDINRVALDNRYGKQAASLYKRRRGSGPTRGEVSGLFGIGDPIPYKDKSSAFTTGVLAATSAYALADIYLTGQGIKGNQRRATRWPIAIGFITIAYFVLKPSQ